MQSTSAPKAGSYPLGPCRCLPNLFSYNIPCPSVLDFYTLCFPMVYSVFLWPPYQESSPKDSNVNTTGHFIQMYSLNIMATDGLLAL